MNPDRITYFAETDFRNQRKRFGIKARDRARHMYVIGKTGMGKSTLLENMAVQDIQNGEGMAFIDPHGGTAEKLLDYIPEHRIKDVVYFAPFDMDFPVSFNVMEDVGVDKRHLVASGLMSSFKKIWVDAWSARMEYILNNILLALLEYPDSTLLGVNRMLSDKDYRKKVVENISDPSVKSFWVDEFAKYGDRYMQEAGAAIQNKIGQFTANPVIRNIIGQSKSTFDIRKLMDEKKILIMNLSKGRIGEQNASLLGGMLITKIYLGAMSRADASADSLRALPNFYFYVDEFQSFSSDSFADILSEARKYKLNLIIAHQYVEQMSEVVRAAVFGNVGTMVLFRVGSYDAQIFEKEFTPQFTADDIVNLGRFQMYLRLMIDDVGSKPFSSIALAPIAQPEQSFKEAIVAYSREHNARDKAKIEADILLWHAPIEPPKKKVSEAVQELNAKMAEKPTAPLKQSAPVPSAPISPAPIRPAPVAPVQISTPTPAPVVTPIQPVAPAPRPQAQAPKPITQTPRPQAPVQSQPAKRFPFKDLKEVTAPANRPEIVQPVQKLEIKTVVQAKPAPQPPASSPKMSALLEQLEADSLPSGSPSLTTSPRAGEEKAMTPISLKTLEPKKYPPKEAQASSMNALKDILAKAMTKENAVKSNDVAVQPIEINAPEKKLVEKTVMRPTATQIPAPSHPSASQSLGTSSYRSSTPFGSSGSSDSQNSSNGSVVGSLSQQQPQKGEEERQAEEKTEVHPDEKLRAEARAKHKPEVSKDTLKKILEG